MKTQILAGLATLALAGPALANGDSGDSGRGERLFLKCKACHSIVKPDGGVVVKGGKVGPDLYGVIGRKAGTEPGFNYGAGLKELGDKGVVWTVELVSEYVENPTEFVREKTGDAAARSNMSYKLAEGGEDVAAYLASVAPAAN